MKKFTNTNHSNTNYIFAENIDYLQTGKDSIWGKGDKETLTLLTSIHILGKWLNLAAGDGRYNDILLTKADNITATDIDESALAKIRLNTPEYLRKKLITKQFNLLDKFPFDDHSFDGVFCTGTLHLFPEKKLQTIFSEIDRVLQPGGMVIIDFATDIKRILPNGKQYKREKMGYTLNEAVVLLKKLLQKYTLNIIQSTVLEEIVNIGKLSYKFSCRYVLITGKK